MMEIKAKLLRGTVFLNGEILQCLITFSIPPIPDNKTSRSHNEVFEDLAWASAQIQCLRTDQKSNNGIQRQNSETALSLTSEYGRIEVSTQPKILFCDLRLSPGESKSYLYEEILPSEGPPSYRGQAVKYSYKITIGTQKVNQPVRLLRVPIKVLPLSINNFHEVSGICNDTTEELTPANPFLESRPAETPMELALQGLQNITARRNPNFYVISNARGKVARFCLFKNAYKLGEDIIGTFDFSVATVNCIQLSVSLQSEEVTIYDSGKPNKEINKRTYIATYNKHHEMCSGLSHSYLSLAIPLHVTPAFSTPTATLKWRLHFEFVTSTTKGLNLTNLDAKSWQAPGQVEIETMVWSLPIRIFPVTPMQVSLALQVNDEYLLKLN